MTLSTQPYKGTRDYYPEDMELRNYIFSIWREVVQSYGYREYSTPILEPLEAYAAKSGDELANEQTYTFTDRGGRQVAIRPEMTPSVSRMVAAKRQEIAYPARMFSIANFMRYERPQRGREREFWQLNVDVFGSENVSVDAETIQLADRILRKFGADESMFKILVNNRRLVDLVMSSYLGLDELRSLQMVKLLDRRAKIPVETFDEQAWEILGQSTDARNRLGQILEAKTIEELPESIASSDAALEVRRLFDTIREIGVTTAVFDITLMRGLDYYTGTVFEVVDLDPENNRSMFGGGRYDGLVGMYGVEPISAIGFAPGLTTTEIFIRSHNLVPAEMNGVDIYVASVGDTEVESLKLAAKLRQDGLSVETDTSGRKFDKLIKTAEKKRATEIVFVGEREISEQKFTAKNLQTGEERRL